MAAKPEKLIASKGPVRLAPETVHVWEVSLRGSSECLAWCEGRLSIAEHERAKRFVYRRDHDDYVFAHGLLRHVLERYTGIGAADIRFVTGASGKPALQARHPKISFNLAHSHGRALIAVSDGAEVGVDLERARPDLEPLAIARSYFFGSERAAIEQAPMARRHEVFLQYWVAKEAVLKGQGVGLGLALDRFEVRFLAESASARIVSFDARRLANDWRVRMLPCAPSWLGAVALRGDNWKVDYST